ncbi:LuxR C-terminal-related transcriptional regulator [Brachybacterium sp. YJGR34]|uniref:LuxR C-terminal-related transcriptional regulator n=1 Tax=Brachybacterium sp. YJGR34 TaxID=2059911 RepID=UPI00272A6E7A|nr:LuxR C-terminal-related transcriptional regulator [Brachybacterium sp. YJGR34]
MTTQRRTTGIPRLPRNHLPRHRLWAQLDRSADHAITTVVAPAGSGKTLGAVGWLRRAEAEPDVHWIDADADLDATALAAILDEPGPGPESRRVVIDDAHLLPRRSVSLLDERLHDVPESLRVLLLARWDLPLTRLVPELLGHCTSLRGDLLRLDREEARTLIRAHAPESDPSMIEAISSSAQGWCAPLVLTARVVSSSPSAAADVRRRTEAGGLVTDQLVNGVFATLRSEERHLLLCAAAEPTLTTATAVHLTRDPRAADALARLEATGLLVTRTQDPVRETPGDGEPESRFRIHPLLREAARRRLRRGGVDALQARSTVSRAVALDLSHGDGSRAVDRLVSVQEIDRAADLLATEGVTLVLRGEGRTVADLERHHPEAVDAHPEAWFAVALDRWWEGDLEAALGWMDHRVPRTAEDGGHDGPAVSCVRLMRSRLSLEHPGRAVERATATLEAGVDDQQVLHPLLLAELGTTQNWTGDLAAAERHLSRAVERCRQQGLVQLAAVAASQLAVNQLMRGRESAASDVAAEALRLLGTIAGPRPPLTRDRAELVRSIVRLVGLPRTAPSAFGGLDATELPVADPCGSFWLCVQRARLAVLAGTPVDGERILSSPLPAPVAEQELPAHLLRAALLEHAVLAALGADREGLRTLEARLRELELPGEAALVRGLREDLGGDRSAATAAFGAAAAEAITHQPPTRAIAQVCRAQLLDAAGEEEAAAELLREAVRSSEVRGTAAPFFGWVRLGTPVGPLLRRLLAREGAAASPWLAELATATQRSAGASARYAPSAAGHGDRGAGADLVVAPALSPREREVLNELARGATYADIAGTLFVSENTVKTHVSSLYGKLAVSRRSEALARARSLNLL